MPPSPSPSPSILLLPTTTPASYTHPCIPVATAAITRLLTAHNLRVTVAPSSAADLVTFFFPLNPSKGPGTPTDPDPPTPAESEPNTTTTPTTTSATSATDPTTDPTTTDTVTTTSPTTTNDPLSPYTLLILLHSAGDFLPPPVLPFFSSFLSRGGSIVAIHGAATGMPSFPLYGSVLGGVFKHHPPPSLSTVQIVAAEHPIISASFGRGKGIHREGNGWEWEWYDEWYEFETDPREVPGVEVLISGGGQGAGYPVAWCREGVEGERGRVFYTALGHFEEAYEDEGFMGQVLGGVMWALAGEQ